jgi:hypothetical protein
METDLAMLDSIARSAAQYGPFLFAVLFILIVTRTAHKYYQESNTRQQPPATEEEKATYRSYFTISIWVGIALTLVSIGWWIYVQMQGTNVYQIAINGLQPNETVSSNYYSMTKPEPTIPGAVILTDYLFMVVQNAPFKVGDKFEIYYFKIPPRPSSGTAGDQPSGVGIAPVPLQVQYSGNPSDTYQVTQNGGTVALTTVAANPANTGNLFSAHGIKALGQQLASTVTQLKGSDR